MQWESTGIDRHPSKIRVLPFLEQRPEDWMIREARQHVPEGFAVATLQGPHQHIKEPREKGGPLRYGFGWLTNFRPEESQALHHRAVLDLVETLVAQGVAQGERVFLMGFSQSCALN